MIVLDTDHISELQQPNSVRGMRLSVRLGAVPQDQIATTIVSAEEQMRGWLAAINKQPAGVEQVDAYADLLGLFQFYRTWLVLPFDELAAQRFGDLRAAKVRISTMDLKIAAIVLTLQGTLLSANLRDFRQVPGLSVEDWLGEA